MRKIKIILTSLVMIWLGCVACTHEPELSPADNSLNTQVGITPENKSSVELALALFPGTVREVEREVEEGQATWKVDILGSEGSEVEIYVVESSGNLFRIDGDKGPFTYDIDPGAPLLSFSEAKERADLEVGESLESWRLRKEDAYQHKWVYQFTYPEKEVMLNAEDGSILAVKN